MGVVVFLLFGDVKSISTIVGMKVGITCNGVKSATFNLIIFAVIIYKYIQRVIYIHLSANSLYL